MACLSVDQIAVYVAALATAVETTAIESHVDRCEPCRRSVATAVRLTRGTTDATSRATRLGRYVVIDELGAGGMGVVYRAFDPELGRSVAVKRLRAAPSDASTDARARLAREARLLAALSHPNVVTVFDLGTSGDETFVAMELVAGTTLRRWLVEPRTPAEIVDAFVQAGRGLAAAHAAGVVHRDFKPENVLVRPDGRVQVTDFGLARMTGEPEVPLEGADPTRSQVLVTERGAVMGTPPYMAPEQIRGESADARTDQFAFAVALVEAVTGERPFPAAIEARRAAFERGDAPSAVAKLPAWLRPSAVRALALDPAGRFPAMDALVARLARDPHRIRRRAVAALGVAVVASLATAVVGVAVRGPAVSCKSPTPRLAGIWDEARKREVRATFLATNRGFAADTYATTERALDAYTSKWAAGEVGACEDTRVRGTQSEAMLDLRIACLDRRLHAVDALADVLAHADATVVESAPRAVQQLPPVAACDDRVALETTESVPGDPVSTARVAADRARLDEARALEASGRLATAAPIADAIVRDARATGYPPLLAEALLVRGMIEADGERPDAEATFADAADQAEAGHADVLRSEAWAELVRVAAAKAHFPEVHAFAKHANAVLVRLGPGHEDVQARIAAYEGMALMDEGDYGRARELEAKALAIRERLYAGEGPEVADALNNVGAVEYQSGHMPAARVAYERALAMRTRLYGPLHPDVAGSHSNLARVLASQGESEPALAHADRARTIYESVYGAESPQVGQVLANLAELYRSLERPGDCITTVRRALAIEEKVFAPGHPLLASLHSIMGECELANGDPAAAEPELRFALERLRASFGDVQSDVLAARSALASVALARGDLREARAGYEQVLAAQLASPEQVGVAATHAQLGTVVGLLGDRRAEREHFAAALALDEREFGPSHPDIVIDLAGLGDAMLGEGDARGALVPLERAAKLADSPEVEQSAAADAYFTLAQALWQTGERGARARELATAAKSRYAALGKAKRNEVRRVEQWLASH